MAISTTSRPLGEPRLGSETLRYAIADADGRWQLGFAPESSDVPPAALDGRSAITLLLGDDAEWQDVGAGGCMGSAVALRFDRTQGSVAVWSSITGLPPIFLCRRPDRVILTSDLSLLATCGSSLQFDPAAVVGFFQTGYPTGHRSLFKDTSLVPGGHVVRIRADGQVSSTATWTLPDSAPRLDWRSYIELQAQTFRAAIRRMDLSRSFLSLTGGVDTRTILAVLVDDGLSLPAATLTGATLSLDARVARALSETYSFPHYVVSLGTDFLHRLPSYVVEASRRSGGLSGLEEAGEVYFYRQLGDIGARRLSGCFGNQVARQGFERLSPLNADLSVLAEGFITGTSRQAGTAVAPGTTPWHSAYERLLQEDGTLPSVGNSCIGQHFATQQTPYASRAMIESLGRSPIGLESVGPFSRSRARLRDVCHRFLGEPTDRSFQRALISQVGGRVASCPVNWGWRPSGGVSPRGVVMGAAACLDQVASWPNPVSRGLGKLLRGLGAEGYQEIKRYRAWLTDWLKDFVHDTLLSQATRQSGLFNANQLARVLREHYVLGQSRTPTIIAALDLALAHQLFCVEPPRGEAVSG